MNERRLPEPIATMIREHETLLALLDDLSNGVAAQGVPDAGKLAELVNSFLHCMNTHIYKEEEILFPCVRVVLGNDAVALEIFEVEHAAVGDLLSQFSDLAKRLLENETCDPRNIARLAELTGRACEVMPPHIFKEDNVLYPLASQIISKETLRKLAAEAKNASRTE
ncbi:MAG: hemerythrin domain-containing protein [Armatimonadota bacterium]